MELARILFKFAIIFINYFKGSTQSGASDVLQHGRVVITAQSLNNDVFVPGITEYEFLGEKFEDF